MLKYIHKHLKISKAEILKKFPDFYDCLEYILDYLYVEDKNQEIQLYAEVKLANEAKKVCKSVSEMSEYMSSHRKEVDYDNFAVTYSTNILFRKLLEEKQRKFKESFIKLSVSLLKFVITYILGIASGLIIAYLAYKFGWQ